RSNAPSALPTLLKRASTSRCCFSSSLTGSMMRCLLSGDFLRCHAACRVPATDADGAKRRRRTRWKLVRFAAPLTAQLHHRGPHERRRDCRSDRRCPPELAGFLLVVGDPSHANPYAGGVGGGAPRLSLG